MTWGPKEKFLQDLYDKTGILPKALEDKEELTLWTEKYYRAFMSLVNSREITMNGIGYIPLSEIKAYLDLFKITDPEDVQEFLMMMEALDEVYVRHINSKLSSSGKKGAKN